MLGPKRISALVWVTNIISATGDNFLFLETTFMWNYLNSFVSAFVKLFAVVFWQCWHVLRMISKQERRNSFEGHGF